MFFLRQSHICPPFQDKLLMSIIFLTIVQFIWLANFFQKAKKYDSIIFKSNLREK
jgi:hypothetical protein